MDMISNDDKLLLWFSCQGILDLCACVIAIRKNVGNNLVTVNTINFCTLWYSPKRFLSKVTMHCT